MNGIAFYNEEFFTIKKDKPLYAEAIQRILMTDQGERVGQPFFGVGLKKMLFELADQTTAEVIKEKIRDQVDLYLPMLVLTKIDSTIENNSLYLKIGFIEKGESIQDERILTLEFEGIGEA